MQTQTKVTSSLGVPLNEKSKAPVFLYGDTHKQTQNFDSITYTGLCKLAKNPVDLRCFSTNKDAKNNCPWFLPSDAPAKTKAVAIEHDNYTSLVIDIDEGNTELSKVVSQLKSLSLNRFLIYSTIKHQLTEGTDIWGNRWRVVIPLSCGVTYEQWSLMQRYLTGLFGGDSCAIRSQQISYLPARYKGKYESHCEGPQDES